jgi:hypothetical protein
MRNENQANTQVTKQVASCKARQVTNSGCVDLSSVSQTSSYYIQNSSQNIAVLFYDSVNNKKMSTTNNQPNQSLVARQSATLSTLNSLVDNHFECSICIDSYTDPHAIP